MTEADSHICCLRKYVALVESQIEMLKVANHNIRGSTALEEGRAALNYFFYEVVKQKDVPNTCIAG